MKYIFSLFKSYFIELPLIFQKYPFFLILLEHALQSKTQ